MQMESSFLVNIFSTRRALSLVVTFPHWEPLASWTLDDSRQNFIFDRAMDIRNTFNVWGR